jgi:hypothetical protein
MRIEQGVLGDEVVLFDALVGRAEKILDRLLSRWLFG